MDDIERIGERLENIESVRPLINSLRTIAAGGWRMALRHLNASRSYVEHLSEVLAYALSHTRERNIRHPAIQLHPGVHRRALMLVVASERGLCGGYNDVVLEGADSLIAQQMLQSDQVLVATLGSRATSHFESRGIQPYATYALPVTRVAPFMMIRELGQSLVEAYSGGEFDAVYLIGSPYRAAITLPPTSERWLPVDLSTFASHGETWPPPTLETDARTLVGYATDEWIFASLYQRVMSSSASEHSARYRAMDNASANIDRMIDELTLSYHTARQHAITMEMLDLVSASGLLRGSRGQAETEA